MRKFIITYQLNETMPEKLAAKAKELDLTVEQLVKRFITSGMREYDEREGPARGAHNFEHFMIVNGVIKPDSEK
jgi:hypothetical protein